MSVEAAIPERMVCPHCRALFRGRFARCPRDGSALQAAVLDPLVGHTFADRYIVEDLLGEGAMGRVYKARHIRMSRRFAIKVLFGDQTANHKMVARFQREAEAASRLGHPNVVSVIDFGETAEGLLYLAMDLAAGPDLNVVIGREGALGGDRTLALTAQLCEGLAHAHARGLVHRDFKPENIIIEASDHGDVARICDFGIAVLQDEDDDPKHTSRLTTDGLVVGTPHYMAPEQAVGDEVDQRTDLFALGVIVYEMLSGKLPFDGAPAEVARMHLSVDPPPISRRAPGLAVDPLIEALAIRLMAKRPDDRPASARDVLELIKLIRHDRPAAARALGVPDRAGSVLYTEPMASITARDSALAPDLMAAPTAFERPHKSQRFRLLPPVSRRMLLAAAAVAIIVAALVTVIGRDRRPALAAAPVDAAVVAVPSAALDAGAVIAEIAVPDAGVPDAETAIAIAEPDAAPTGLAPKRPPDRTATPRTPTRPAVVPAKPAVVPAKPAVVPAKPAVVPAKPEPPALADLTGSVSQRYRTVGRQLDQLVQTRGEAAAAPLKARYLSIPISDAIRNPEVGAEVTASLAALHRDIERAMR